MAQLTKQLYGVYGLALPHFGKADNKYPTRARSYFYSGFRDCKYRSHCLLFCECTYDSVSSESSRFIRTLPLTYLNQMFQSVMTIILNPLMFAPSNSFRPSVSLSVDQLKYNKAYRAARYSYNVIDLSWRTDTMALVLRSVLQLLGL